MTKKTDMLNVVALVACTDEKLRKDYGLSICNMPSPWAEQTFLRLAETFPFDPSSIAFALANDHQRINR